MHAFNLEDIGKQKGHCKDKVEGKPAVGKSNISEQEIHFFFLIIRTNIRTPTSHDDQLFTCQFGVLDTAGLSTN